MKRALLLSALLAAFGLCGCATTMHVEVDTTPKTNQGRPIYMLIRSVDGQALVSEDYGEAAARVFAYPRDPSVQKVQAILPGQTVKFTLDRPDQGDLAIYFFFTNPGNKWRLPLNNPLPTDVVIDLGTHNINRVRVRRR